MSLTILIIIALVIVAVIYELVHRSLIKRATLIIQRRAQTITDRVVFQALDKLIGQNNFQHHSTLVSDIWGKGVLSFEYDIQGEKKHEAKFADLTRQQMEDQLNQLAVEQQIEHLAGTKKAFRITDWWQGKKQFHMDVTYLMNEASCEYVHDLKKLSE